MSASARWLRWGQRLLLTLGSLSLPATAQELAQASGADCRTMGPRVVLGICAITLIGTFVGLLAVRQRLGREGWSLANALSEPTRLTIPIDPRWSQSQGDKEAETSLPGGVSLVGSGTAGKEGAPVGLTILEASSSRLIALVGMVVILLMYLGFGVFALYSFGLTCQMPASTASVTSFLYAGLTLFAPYVANKVSGILKPVLGNQPPPPPETAGTRLPALPAQGRGGYGLMAPGAMPLSGPSPASPNPPAGPQSPLPTSRTGAAQDAARPARTRGPAPSHPGAPASGAPGLATSSAKDATDPSRQSGVGEPLADRAVAPSPATTPGPATAAAADPYAPAVALIARFEGFVDHA